MSKLIKISELSKILNNINPKTKKPLNYILRYWEKNLKKLNENQQSKILQLNKQKL